MDFTKLAAELTANPNCWEEADKYAPLPNGTYAFLINKADEEDYLFGVKQDGIIDAMANEPSLAAGKQVAIELEVVDGPNKGRKIWDRLVFQVASNHPDYKNFTAQQRMDKDVKSIMAAFAKSGASKEAIANLGFAALSLRQISLNIGQRSGKDGVVRNQIHWSAPAGARPSVATSRPVLSDEPPF